MNKVKYNISDYKLKVIINELGEEYKDLLIERILSDMHENDADLINPSDLIRLDVMTKSNLRTDKKVQRQNRMLSMISILGIVYALVGLMLMQWSEVKDIVRYDSMMMMSFVLIFLGLFVALFSLLFKNMGRIRPQYYREKNYTISSYEVINKWKEIEALVHELTPREDTLSLSSMMSNLKDTQIISEQDIEIINQLLNIRNQIVHGQDNKYNLSQEELRAILLQADKIISKMKKLL